LTFDLIGYSGLPSNHSVIVSSMAALIALKDGCNQPAFGVAITLAFIVTLDASGLRKKVGEQARVINKILTSQQSGNTKILRERIGHTLFDMLAVLIVGIVVAHFEARA